jgi:hypothetical protein
MENLAITERILGRHRDSSRTDIAEYQGDVGSEEASFQTG